MATVTMIPARPAVGARKKTEEAPKLRVAAYCRVSTETDEQATSYDAQIEHYTDYIEKHPGWELAGRLQALLEARGAEIFDKPAFGSLDLARRLAEIAGQGKLDEVELAGLCTDICVVSNALLIKAFLPEIPLAVDASACGGTTPARHEAALDVMASCQIDVRR